MSNFVMSEYAFGNIGTCREVPIDALTNPKHLLTAAQIHKWATLEARLSYGYKNGSIPPSSQFKDGARYIGEVMNDLDHTFLHVFSDLNAGYLERGGFREIFRRKIEDPGMLHNAVYFEVGKDPAMIGFYWHTWRGDMAKSMDFLHNFGWDPYNRCQKIDENSAWYHMSMIEGMNNSEREKISHYVSRVRKMTADLNRLPKITCFGGGNLPERHYGLPEAEITVFDNGSHSPMDQLFPNPVARSRVRYINNNLLTAIEHPELFGTQDIVTMFGVALYLKESGTVQALTFGEELLRDKGMFAFDLLVLNESMRRVFWTQWPVAQKETMVFESAPEAMTVGLDLVNTANEKLEKKHVMLISEPPIVTKVGPWGNTGVRFYLKKHIL
ncbi:hypothetical protein IKF74_01915 [Candidatus Saccharibacteria bacterium]|nr:hypothetical protein [Candidatus Saccharibacteria bacterium]